MIDPKTIDEIEVDIKERIAIGSAHEKCLPTYTAKALIDALRAAQAEIERLIRLESIVTNNIIRGWKEENQTLQAEIDKLHRGIARLEVNAAQRLHERDAEIERLRARPSTSQAIAAVEKLRDEWKATPMEPSFEAPSDWFVGQTKSHAASEIISELRALPVDPFNPLSYAAGARRAVDVAKRLADGKGLVSGAFVRRLESLIETELVGSAGERKATEAAKS